MAKRALLVGINDYKEINDLAGCINDVTNMRDILKTHYKFTNNEIRVLTDSRATRQNILTRLDWLKEGAKPGDTLVFHFSGHGSQIRDRGDQDELRDHKDEILCCYDISWDNGYILDDEIDSFFESLPDGVRLEVILDCCYSGTGQSIVPRNKIPLSREFKEKMETVKNRFLEPPMDIDLRSEGDNLEVKRFSNAAWSKNYRPTGPEGPGSRSIWSGCGEQQTSADAFINDSFNGAFTYYFCKIIRNGGSYLSRSDVLDRLRSSLRHNRYTQIPELTCVDLIASQGFLN